MKLVGFSIRRKVLLSMVYIIAVGMGIFGITQLKVAMTPDLDFPMVIVSTAYTGVSPEDIENLVTRTIEEAVSATENVKKVTSQSSNGRSMVLLEFEWGSDMKQAETDVRNKIDLIRDYLPTDATEPVVIKINPSMMPIMYLSMSSQDLGPAELRRLAEDKVEPLLERVKGVASVSVNGGYKRRINVNLNPVLLTAHSLSPSTISSAIQSSAGLVSSGSIKTASKEYNLRIYSEYRTIDQIRNVVIKQGPVPVYLKDVATVEDGVEESTSDVRINGGQGIALLISKQSDANTVQAANEVRKALVDIKKTLPQGIDFVPIFDSSKFTSESMNNLKSTAIMSIIVVVFILYLFLRNWRGSLIMAISMPISILLTFGLLMLSDLTLNVISMAGLALAIGMLVDNSVVVLENIFRHRDMGKDLNTAADKGASEMAGAITGSTLTTIAVFVPVLFVPGITSQLFREMVLTITFSLGVSLIVALTLVPLMASVMLKKRKKNSTKAVVEQIENKKPSGIKKVYRSILHWSLYHKKIVLGSSILLFLGSFALLPLIGGEFMPKTDESRLSFTVECATGMPLSSMREKVIQIEKILKEEVPETETSMFQFGAQSGFGPGQSKSNTISATIKLVPIDKRKRSQTEIENAFRKRLDNIPGITYSFSSGGMMGSGEKAIDLKIVGHDLVRAKAIADKIKSKMEQIPGFVDIQLSINDYIPQLDVHLNQGMLSDLKLTNLQVASIVSTAIQGRTVAQYREKGDEYDIYVQFDQKYRQNREALGDIVIPLSSGGSIPLRQIAEIKEAQSPVTIYRENQERYVSIGSNLAKLDLAKATKIMEQILTEVSIPSDFTMIMGGTAEDQKESTFYMMIAFAVAAVLVYMVMAAQFESLVDPFIIMFTVPLSIIGVFGILFLTHTPISIMALVGLVMLVGIAVNNGIVLVDYINQTRHDGVELYKAAELSAILRLRPVLMTALTTIIGMLPMALEIGSGSETWAPLARVVIGGLTVTTILTLVVIPSLYVVFEEWGAKFKKFLFRT